MRTDLSAAEVMALGQGLTPSVEEDSRTILTFCARWDTREFDVSWSLRVYSCVVAILDMPIEFQYAVYRDRVYLDRYTRSKDAILGYMYSV